MAAKAEPLNRRQDQGAPLLRRGSLGELAARLERLKATRQDVVTDTRDLTFRVGADGPVLDVPHVGALPLTRHAHTQVAEKTGIPQRYYDRMAEQNAPLLAENVNAWFLKEPAPRLVRAAEGHVRALLSDRYRVIDSEDVALLVADRAEKHHADVIECALSETRMSIRVAHPNAREKVGELTAELRARHTGIHQVRAGSVMNLDADYMVPGLVVSNSEVGAGAMKVEPIAYRLICWNAAVGEESLAQVHLGGKLGVGEITYREETLRLSDQALAAQIQDVVDGAFNPDSFRKLVQRFKDAKSVEIAKPVEVTNAVVKLLGINEDRKEALLRHFMLEGPTVFGLVNGITAFAQEEADPDAQLALERAAGDILAKPDGVLALA